MHTRLTRPHQISPTDLDRWLARGWYRVGQTMMTCTMLLAETGLRSAVWTRVPLAGYRFKRSHRKLLSKVDRAYRIVEGPATLDSTREDLYQRYLTVARGSRPDNLRLFLHGDAATDLFSTREIAMWEGDRLIAFSWFDVGWQAMQSLIGVYDPERAHQSLGFTTLLLEMRESMRLGLHHHYSGYVLPGDPQMDYKLRPGSIEFLHHETREWRPWVEMERRALPAETLYERLRAARSELASLGIPSELITYPPYTLRSPQPERIPLLAEPLALDLEAHQHSMTRLLATWDLEGGHYRLRNCVRATAHPHGSGAMDMPSIEVLVIQEELATPTTSTELARVITMARGRR